MSNWAALELAPWSGVKLPSSELLRRQRAICRDSVAFRLFQVSDGTVWVEQDLARRHDNPAIAEVVDGRQELYRALLQEVVAANVIDRRFALLLFLGDEGPEFRDLPYFAFQKVRGSPTLLLPDVDLIQLLDTDWAGTEDCSGFDEKSQEAIFVGSTTGQPLTAEVLRQDANQRVRTALYFRDIPGVTFELPGIIQCDTPDTVEAVRQLRLGSEPRGWDYQFRRRYLISMDGNGATCSRVAIALKSNCVLVKYNSPHLLYYFHGLTPWLDYVPMRRNLHLAQMVEHAAVTAERDRAIAMRGRAFAQAHLNRAAMMDYVAALLRGYAALFGADAES